MKKILSFLTIAILGGVVSLYGYISFFDNGHLITETKESPIQTFQTNFIIYIQQDETINTRRTRKITIYSSKV